MRRWELIIAWCEKIGRAGYEIEVGRVGSDSSCYESFVELAEESNFLYII